MDGVSGVELWNLWVVLDRDGVFRRTSQSIQTKGSVERSSGIVNLWRMGGILGC